MLAEKLLHWVRVLRGLLVYVLGLGYLLVVQGPQLPITPLLSRRGHNLQARGFSNFSLLSLRYISGLSYEIYGEENLPDEAYVIVANHQSAWETVFFAGHKRPLVSILKKELFWIPVYGISALIHGHVFIDRQDKREAIRRVLDQGVERLKSGLSVLIFPEGTRVSLDGGLGRFSLGAAHMAIASGAPIVPAAHNAGLFWPRKRIAKRPGTVTLRYGKPIYPQGKTATVLTREVRSAILDMLRELPGIQQPATRAAA